MADGTVKIKVEWDDSKLSKDIKSTQKEIEKKLDDVTVEAKLNVEDSQIDEALKKVDDLDTTAETKVNADDSDLDNAQKKVDGLKSEKISIPVEADTSGLNLGGIVGGTGTAIAGVVTGIGGLSIAMQEYNSDLAKLETNTTLAGGSFDYIKGQMELLNGVTGETDSNVEALSNLMQAGFSGDTLGTVVDQLAGAVIKFPDTLKIEGLADGLQETLATGKAIGPFAELLERMGVDLETFDAGLAESAESGTQLDYALQALTNLDLSSVTDEYMQQNEAMTSLSTAQFKLNDAMAQLGIVAAPVTAMVITMFADLLSGLMQNEQLMTSINDLFAAVGTLVEAVFPVLVGVLTALAPVISTILVELAAMVVQILPSFLEVLPLLTDLLMMILPILIQLFPAISQIMTAFFQLAQAVLPLVISMFQAIMPLLTWLVGFIGGALADIITFIYEHIGETATTIQTIVTSLVDMIGALFEGDLQGYVDAAESYFTALGSFFSGIFTGDFELGADLVRNALNSLSSFLSGTFEGGFTGAFSSIASGVSSAFSSIVSAATGAVNGVVSMFNSLISTVNGAIRSLNSLSISFPVGLPLVGGRTFSLNVPSIPSIPYLARGGIVTSATQAVVGEAGTEAVIPLERNTKGVQMIADKISEQMNLDGSNGGVVVINLDGREIARAVFPHINKSMNASVQYSAKGAY